ncbi:hypothetical protein PLICRDRAFT_46749 [Plicaturopsis crispa FD-325 SS-3]|uniref:Uncharacterized protein n=1 Tax=Plicaturopsis crispa FD-325 SS-3 TaxID=944288 RepID=A0A0C9SKM1_PLICR|nr:hypothetical protein PLICRDRAFT_46749 [Plicaturopsis crispa FD-325 SS-3]
MARFSSSFMSLFVLLLVSNAFAAVIPLERRLEVRALNRVDPLFEGQVPIEASEQLPRDIEARKFTSKPKIGTPKVSTPKTGTSTPKFSLPKITLPKFGKPKTTAAPPKATPTPPKPTATKAQSAPPATQTPTDEPEESSGSSLDPNRILDTIDGAIPILGQILNRPSNEQQVPTDPTTADPGALEDPSAANGTVTDDGSDASASTSVSSTSASATATATSTASVDAAATASPSVKKGDGKGSGKGHSSTAASATVSATASAATPSASKASGDAAAVPLEARYARYAREY